MSRLVMLGVAATIALAPTAAASDCMQWGLAPKVLNPGEAIDPTTGGLIVGAVPEARGSLDKGDVAVRDWRFSTGKGTVKAVVTSIAPGLAVYRPSAGASALELVDDKQVSLAKLTLASGKLAALAAPKVRAIRFDNRINRRIAERLTVELEERPAGAVALIVADRQGTPRSWGLVGPSTSVIVYSSHDCQVLPNGTVPSRTGDSLVVYFVDASGRLSAKTRPIRVTENVTTAAPPPP